MTYTVYDDESDGAKTVVCSLEIGPFQNQVFHAGILRPKGAEEDERVEVFGRAKLYA